MSLHMRLFEYKFDKMSENIEIDVSKALNVIVDHLEKRTILVFSI